MPDSEEHRHLAAKHRDKGGLSPGDPDYDRKLSELWGGPPPAWYEKGLEAFATEYGLPLPRPKLALVTGGAGGIGFYVVKALVMLGYDVLIPPRPGMEDDAREAAEAASRVAAPGVSAKVAPAPLDLASLASVRSFGIEMREQLPQLDLLCLNAGRGGGTDDRREVTTDGHEAIMQVNALGHFLLASELVPLLRKSSSGRIASQSSAARYQGKPSKVRDLDGKDAGAFNAWDQYCLSKACNVLFTLELNERLAAAGIRNVIATASDPGLTATGVNIQHDLVKSLGMGGRFSDTNRLHDLAGHHAADGALALIMASIDPYAGPGYFYTAGKAHDLSSVVRRLDPEMQSPSSRATDPLCEEGWPASVRQLFWEQATRLTGADWREGLSPAGAL